MHRSPLRLAIRASLLALLFGATTATVLGVTPKQDAPSLDAVAQLLSGSSADAVSDLEDRAKFAKRYASDAQSLWEVYDKRIGSKIVKWATETVPQPDAGTIFYPFAGPDFPTVYQFYPNAERYVLVALQKGGRVPSLRRYNTATFKAFMRLFSRGWTSFSKRGFFHTDHMKRDMEQGGQLEGITPILMAFAERMGFRVDAIVPVGIGTDGKLAALTEAVDQRETWDSVRLSLTRRSDGKKVTLDYVFLDLSDGWLKAHDSDRQWVRAMTANPIVTKAASHLMQKPFFSLITGDILAGAPSVLQDETGLDYKAMKGAFDVTLYGNFSRANKLWTEGVQRSLAKAYQRGKGVEPLPFKVGYRKDSGSCIQYGTRR